VRALRSLTAVLALLAVLPAAAAPGKVQTILGRVEMVEVRPAGALMQARIDTGAGLTSIDARGLTVEPATDRQPERATFWLRDQSPDDPPLVLDVIDWIGIKGKGTKRVIRRPVVLMSLCIGDRLFDVRVNLADRSTFTYPLLIGRDTLIAGRYLVDASARLLVPPRCSPAVPDVGDDSDEE
jgi:hypothetical protein